MGPHFVMPEFAAQISAELDEFCHSVVERASLTGHPFDMLLLAQQLGIEVAIDAEGTQRARCVRLQQGLQTRWLLLLRGEVRPERLQWAAAHEIGEILALDAMVYLGWDVNELQPAGREWLANEIAKRLLLPFPQFLMDGRELGWDLIRLKERYPHASHEVIARRMLDAPIPLVITIFDNGELYWRRSNAVFSPPPLTCQERSCWKTAHHTGQAIVYEDHEQSIGCWAIHEEGWRREIMRTQAYWLEW
ncbi:MAG: hypothetical protein ACUVQG_00850 [Thermogutta sp.]